MQDGIYHVRFSSSLGGSGEGLAVIKHGTVNGGDLGYVYVGSLAVSGNALTGRLNIRRWNQGVVSVLGPLENFELQLSGQSAGPHAFAVSGGIPSYPGLSINIAGQFVSPAA
jgi:hypothetical protein